MPARTDHDRRDAQHSARIAVVETIARYQRRVVAEAYAHIDQELAEYDGSDPIDWSQVGRLAAHRALGAWGIPTAAPEHALDGEARLMVDGDSGELPPAA